MKILIIEDDATLNRMLVLHLKYKGYETESAFGGVEGLLLATRLQPDLVMLDVMMPVMDGWEVHPAFANASRTFPLCWSQPKP